MADNYLERKMEEHRNGGHSRPSRRSPSGNRPGKITIPFPERRVAVIGSDIFGEAILRAFANAGCRVAFCGTDRSEGTRLAQSSGTCFFPMPDWHQSSVEKFIDGVTERFGDIDILVDTSASVDIVSRLIERHQSSVAPLRIFNLTIAGHPDATKLVSAKAAAAGAILRTIAISPDPSVDAAVRARDVAEICLFFSTDASSIIQLDLIPVK